jgi:hypothetical protein
MAKMFSLSLALQSAEAMTDPGTGVQIIIILSHISTNFSRKRWLAIPFAFPDLYRQLATQQLLGMASNASLILGF